MSQIIEKLAVQKISGLESPHLLQKIKDFVSKIYTDAGYTDSPWKNVNYDPWSTWFYVEGEEGILAAMRITEKFPWNFIPLEAALIQGSEFPPKRYAVIEENVADWNSVAFTRSANGGKAAKVTFIETAKHCVLKGYDMVYGMYNPKLTGIERIYFREGALESVRYPGPMYFPGFYLNGELSWLQVVEIGKECLQKIASKLL
ncbi:hypothetical protein EHQ12_00600 [Leptospira gomenensis]|uniref:GNAT family N-acetyltransferase n=1 Tax=Leptospira gomenensis TaxID=2484974 RepID=A0A5F1YYS3_9LEPT|nr:hypothetical protein [Leptospira gomenensis]TGK39191.1 hypothetical protein EHQ17_00500 [Leptospira gomenensis]TGK44268.1 hypothetical protein EHQ07_12205 [Leptospira gomenensis]TGK45062.1 hypothetical protein EHQ12_00600 [Leptospira gomenensis]TGK65130.1 hypothetical protein EHQ13_06180 [Leptospira gomenensis]